MAVASGLPSPEPEVNIETAPFWDAASRGVLAVPRCDTCGEFFWYPRAICPLCHGTSVSLMPSPGLGAVYTFTVVRKSLGYFGGITPYVLAYVELDEGIRMLTNIVQCDVERLSVGDRVEVVFDETPQGRHVPRFRPVSQPAT